MRNLTDLGGSKLLWGWIQTDVPIIVNGRDCVCVCAPLGAQKKVLPEVMGCTWRSMWDRESYDKQEKLGGINWKI